MQYGFKNYAQEVLREEQKPLSVMEIWEKGKERGYDQKLGSKGKTPWRTLGAILYTDIKENGENSPFLQVSKRPALFALQGQEFSGEYVARRQAESGSIEVAGHYRERDLHPVLAKYLKTNT